MSHIVGRPDDDLLDVMLGDGADPEQAFITGPEQSPEEGDGFASGSPPEAGGSRSSAMRSASSRRPLPHPPG
jgi:hypothetical protein